MVAILISSLVDHQVSHCKFELPMGKIVLEFETVTRITTSRVWRGSLSRSLQRTLRSLSFSLEGISSVLGNSEMGGLTPPAVLSRRSSFRLPFVSIDETRPGSSVFPFLWRSQKMDRFVDRLKKRIVFSRWYLTIARKMKKIVASDGHYFESWIGNDFLRIKPWI